MDSEPKHTGCTNSRKQPKCIPEDGRRCSAGENLDSGKVRNVILYKGFAAIETNRNTGAISAPFIIAVPEIA